MSSTQRSHELLVNCRHGFCYSRYVAIADCRCHLALLQRHMKMMRAYLYAVRTLYGTIRVKSTCHCVKHMKKAISITRFDLRAIVIHRGHVQSATDTLMPALTMQLQRQGLWRAHKRRARVSVSSQNMLPRLRSSLCSILLTLEPSVDGKEAAPGRAH